MERTVIYFFFSHSVSASVTATAGVTPRLIASMRTRFQRSTAMRTPIWMVGIISPFVFCVLFHQRLLFLIEDLRFYVLYLFEDNPKSYRQIAQQKQCLPYTSSALIDRSFSCTTPFFLRIHSVLFSFQYFIFINVLTIRLAAARARLANVSVVISAAISVCTFNHIRFHLLSPVFASTVSMLPCYQ